MITIISGTNRKDSATKQVTATYKKLLQQRGLNPYILYLDETDMTHRDKVFLAIEEQFLVPASKFIFIIPEYNGSYPGIVKLMIDNTDVKKVWYNKPALLTGVSTGRAGNLRGMDHLTGSLMHMKMHVHPNRLPISVVNTLMDKEGNITDSKTIDVIKQQINEFLS